jgi:alkanesulfonate monooxygenase SsuD/methylene tetrahydromethanopterin reductase-like flavin-dependent oxidoreductase (luciferase family)
VSTAIATLDYVSGGRAGWDVAVSPRPDEAAHVGRRPAPGAGELLAEAADAVEVVRRLWDSWADDAVVRDVATGRFVDRDRLRYTDFAGRFFAVKGPSIVPRPPQGQPLVTTLAQLPGEFAFAARAADVVFTTPVDEATALAVVEQARGAEAAAGRAGPPLLVFADLVVFLDERAGTALGRRARLDALDPVPATNAAVFAGDPDRLADLLLSWRRVGVDGFRLWPATLPYDLATITRLLVPALRRRRARVESPPAGSLRARLGLPRPANRYATAAS